MSTTEIFVDGGYRNNRASYGVFVSHNSQYNTGGQVPGTQSAFRAECEAIRQGVLTIKKMYQNGQASKHYTIRSDSQNAVNAIKGSGHNGDAADIINDAIAQIKYLGQQQIEVKVSYVAGHSNHEGNVEAHNLANRYL